ncbi:MAG TPA: translation initiation factor IF-2 [Thermoanaerobaculia bacterium]|nr:translation initiation factor IF-2 [Thermoanaerobaculia bacterium]
MAKVRVSDLAKQMGVSDKDLVFKLQSLGVDVEGPAAAIDHDVIVAILTGKKLAGRPRNVIMREERPQQAEKPRKEIRPPRPIVKPPRPITPATPPAEPTVAPVASGLIIPEFIEAAEAEAAEQERAAREAKTAAEKPSAPKPAIRKPRVETPEAPPPVPEPSRPAVQARPGGPTGPRARTTPTARPDYGQQRVDRPSAGLGTTRARPMGAPPAAPGRRPEMGSRPGVSARPAGRAGVGPMAPPPPPPTMPPAPPTRRRKVDEEERPEKKKTTGKRGKRSTQTEVDSELFTKGPFSATDVLDEDLAPEATARVIVEGAEEEAEQRGAPSTRRDSRKQAAPVTARVLEFRRPAGKVVLTEGVTVKELADKLGVKANDLMKHLLMKKGLMVSINAPLGAQLALDIARDLNIDAELVSFEDALELESLERMAASGAAAGSTPRGPVITVMGHVDHGKTSLLDAIRETNVAEGEAGGITQHIGAYHVEKRGRKIVFLDTPGHEAFTMMRARGAKVTDIVVLVVAADDGVMPQTREAIDHARAANVPIIVAINKIDKPNANPDRVRKELADAGVLVEQWGGEVVSVEVSALKKQGIDDLLDMILLTSDILELKATPELPARGVVLEARKDVGRGIVSTVLVQDGTLRVGDPFFSGSVSGRVRSMADERGNRLKEAGPSTPVSVAGFDEMPRAGDTLQVVDEEAQARMIGQMRQQKAREQSQQKPQPVSLDQLFARMQSGTIKSLNLILKADVQGSVEVLNEAMLKLSNEQVKVSVLHASVGAISTNDILLASASDAIVIGFNVRPERNAAELAEKEGVDIRLHTVIYELIDEIKRAMTGLLEPTLEEIFQGRAEVRDTFRVPKQGTIAGCYVTDGVIPRNAGVRLLRDNRVIYEGKIQSLRHFKNDVNEVRAGFECGIGIERFQDIKVGDVIEAFRVEKLAGVLQ